MTVIQPKEPCPEVFYVEETALMKKLDQFLERQVD